MSVIRGPARTRMAHTARRPTVANAAGRSRTIVLHALRVCYRTRLPAATRCSRISTNDESISQPPAVDLAAKLAPT